MAINDTDYDFTVYPVIKMEFTRVVVRQVEDLENYITNTANSYAQTHDIQLTLGSYEQRFAELVIKLHHKYQQKVVLLIDEHLRFVFITGVSKFAKVSVFSGMNNLNDITMDNRYATLCGVTQVEMESHFCRQIEVLGGKLGLDRPTLLAKIKHWYNGYRFEENAVNVYNPFSLILDEECFSVECENDLLPQLLSVSARSQTDAIYAALIASFGSVADLFLSLWNANRSIDEAVEHPDELLDVGGRAYYFVEQGMLD